MQCQQEIPFEHRSHVVHQCSSRFLRLWCFRFRVIFALPLVHAFPLHLLFDDFGVERVRVSNFFLKVKGIEIR